MDGGELKQAVLLSVQPKWTNLIESGNKTLEIRKNRPQLDEPFKVYIYETKGDTDTPWIDEEGHTIFKGRGMVVGEFICDKVIPVFGLSGSRFRVNEALCQAACLSCDEIRRYGYNKEEIYGWHISNLVVYDVPKLLNEFSLSCNRVGCLGCKHYRLDRVTHRYHCERPVTRAPQSYCFVEELP